MKILHIITGLNNGGAEGVLYRLVTHDESNEHIVISLMDEGKYGPLLIDEGINVHCLNMSQSKPSIKHIAQLYELIKKAKPDVVQTWMYHADLIGGIVAKSLGVKKIFWNIRHSTFDTQHTKPSTLRTAKICSKLSPYIPSKVISCSYVAIEPHIELGYAKDRFVVINNGYNLDTFRIDKNIRHATRKKLGLGYRPLIGMVGRYDPQKNHKGLIESLSIVKNKGYDFDLILVGRNLNYDNRELVKLIKNSSLENNVYLLGQRNDIASIMNALDIHILSSSYGEGFPNVIAEAMACGTPCIATDIGDSKIIVDNFGMIVKPNNTFQLSQAVIDMLDNYSNTSSWNELTLACSEHIKNKFSIEYMVSQYNSVWQN